MEFHTANYGSNLGGNTPPPPPSATMDWGQPQQFGRVGEQQVHQRQGGATPPGWGAQAPAQAGSTPPGVNLPPTQQAHQQQQQWNNAGNAGGNMVMDWGQDFGNAFNPANAMTAMAVATKMAQGGDGIEIAEGLFKANKPGITKYLSWIDGLKIYFRVTNSYVLNKMKNITFPYTTDHRRREVQQMTMSDYEYEAPDSDPNGMDLYLPSMALVTYVLLSAAIRGTSHTFTPEVLGSQTSWCIAVCFLEVIALQILAISLGAVRKMWVCDTICMSGYKFLGICVCLLSRFLLPFPFWCAPFLWFSLASGFLLYSQLMEHFKDYAHGDGKVPIRSKPLILAGVAQPFIFMFLVSNVIVEPPQAQ
eukprot:TRINITY_DN2106_c7_g1_i1.p1 TRINITY_DN2106_c7_g1~~TRINITY_DN2106_c7_g1_i1.p1  ORF type:complete len:362 (+),score=44.90 TRINITY_DN2106_c7_g1_i1:81-1166(+)